jgi:hypothetical protein
VLAFRRVTEHQLERDIGAVDAQATDRLGGDEVLASVGIDDGLQRLHQRLLAQSHGVPPL